MSIRLMLIRTSLVWMALSSVLFVAACGQKGDLYPEAPQERDADERQFQSKTQEQKEKDLHQQQWDDATTRLRERD